MKLGEIVVLQLHQISSKSDEKQKSFFNSSPLFCSEFQSVSRIVKIVHSVKGYDSMHMHAIALQILESQEMVSKKLQVLLTYLLRPFVISFFFILPIVIFKKNP